MDIRVLTYLIVLLLLVIPLITAIFQTLWNTTMPAVFGLPALTFWQAFRLLLIAGFLTSGGLLRFTIRG